MKKFVINSRVLQNSLSGLQRYLSEILKGLDEKNFKYELIAPNKKLNIIKSHLWEQFILPGRVKNCLLWSPANSAPIKVYDQVVTAHDILQVDRPDLHSNNILARDLYKFIWPRVLKNSLGVIAVSNFTKSRILDRYNFVDENKIQVIHEAPDEKFKREPPEKINEIKIKYGINKKYVLSLASLDIKKNLKNLVLAWNLLSELYGDFDLILAGKKHDRLTLKNLGLDKIPDSVKFTGFVADEDLPALYSGAEIFVFPSLYEGFGLPPIEAMACGTPVIVAESSSLPEVCADGAKYIDPYNIESIAHEIKILLENDSERENLKLKGLERSKNFSNEKVISEHIKFFKRYL